MRTVSYNGSLSMPSGWDQDPNWDSDASVWAKMKGPEDATKASGKKRKKWTHDSEHPSYGILAVHEKVTREYLARLLTNTVDNEALTVELRSARRTYALQQAEQARTMVIPTPQFLEIPLHPKYKGKGEPLLHRDPPIPVTGNLPQPLGHSVSRNAEWYDICPREDIHFRELHELAKMTPPADRTWEMNITFQHVQAQQHIDNPKLDWFGVSPGTTVSGMGF
jgi:hypothetical protein